MYVARSRIVRHDESPFESCLRDRGYGDVADEIGARHAYTGRSSAGGTATRPRHELLLEGQGYFDSWVELSDANNGAGFVIVSQQVQGCLCALRAGDIVKSIVAGVHIAGSGGGPTTIKLGLADANFNILAVTANVAADAQWTATSSKAVSFALTANYTVPTDGLYYALFLQDGAFVTTQPSLVQHTRGITTLGAVKAHHIFSGGKTDLVVATLIAGVAAVAQGPFIAPGNL